MSGVSVRMDAVGGVAWFGQAAVVASVAAWLVLANPGSAGATAVRATGGHCPELEGAAAQLYYRDKLCHEFASQAEDMANSGKPMDIGKALKNSTKGKKNLPLPKMAAKGKKSRGSRGSVKELVNGPVKLEKRPHFPPGQLPAPPSAQPSTEASPDSSPTEEGRGVAPPGAPGIVQGTAPAAAGKHPRPMASMSGSFAGTASDSNMPPSTSWGIAVELAVILAGLSLLLMVIQRRALAVLGGGTVGRRSTTRRRRGRPHGEPVAVAPGAAPPLKLDRPGPVWVMLGHRDLAPVMVDLAVSGGLRLIGDGGDGLARSLLVQAVEERRMRVLITNGSLRALLGAEGSEAIAHSGTFVQVEDTTAGLLDALGAELVARQAFYDEPEAARLAGEVEPSALVAFIDPAEHAGRLRTDLNVGAALGVGAVLLGDWQHGTTVTVDASGVVVEATGRATAGLEGARASMLAAIPEPSLTPPVVREIAEPLRLAVVPDGPAVMVRLFGNVTVEGPGETPCLKASDHRALLALLAEYRSAYLPRQVAEGKLWPGGLPTPSRFEVVLREVRGKLCEALKKPGSQGSVVIVNNGTGYRLAEGLLTCDVWRFRDLVAQAAAAGTDEEKAALLAAAVDLYTGPYLKDLPYAWAQTASRAAAREVTHALTGLALLETSRDRAAMHLARAAGIDPASEPLARQRMQAYAEAGNHAAVCTTYEDVTEALKKDGRRPEAMTVELYKRLTTL